MTATMSGTIDPGDTPDTALAISSRDLRRGSVTLNEAISPATDDDYFSFQLRKNQTLTITLETEDPLDVWTFLAFGPNGQAQGFNLAQQGNVYTLTLTAAERGEYSFGITGYTDTNTDTPNGNYTISFG